LTVGLAIGKKLTYSRKFPPVRRRLQRCYIQLVFSRVIWIVLDSVGIGEMPDAAAYGDAGSDTLGNIAHRRLLRLPNLCRLGLGNIKPLEGLPPAVEPAGSFGRCALASPGKDTTTGHWEMAGIQLEKPFPLYPHGFPREILDEFERRMARRTLGNKAASGTEIIKELGAEHMRTGSPIVYTSADSVFQVAAHEEVIPLWELYKICETARELLRGPYEVGRVIARPFIGSPGAFTRTPNRKDYAVPPPRGMLLDVLDDHGVQVHSVGKIFDVFLGRGIRDYAKTKSNADGMAQTLEGHAVVRRRANLRQPGGFRSAIRAPQRCGRIRSGVGAVRRLAAGVVRRRAGRRPGHPDGPTTAAIPPPHPPTIAANMFRYWSAARAPGTASTSGCGRRSRTSARPWPKISERKSRTEPLSYRKSYEKTNHGGQLENVQDPRRNYRVF
jgi:phosphopentomutase